MPKRTPSHVSKTPQYPAADRACIEGLLYTMEALGQLGGAMLAAENKPIDHGLILEIIQFDYGKTRENCPVTSERHRDIKERFETRVLELYRKYEYPAPGGFTWQEDQELQVLGVHYQNAILDDLGI